MKENTHPNELEKIIASVNYLTEESLLKLIYGFINTAMTGDGGDKIKLEVLHKISDIYNHLPNLNKLKRD